MFTKNQAFTHTQQPIEALKEEPKEVASMSQVMAANKPLASMLGILLTTCWIAWAVTQGYITPEDISMIVGDKTYLFLSLFGFAAGATVIGYGTWSVFTFTLQVLNVTLGFAWRVIWFIPGTLLYWSTGIGGKK